MSLQQAIDHAKQNPQSQFAQQLGGFIQKGEADEQAMHEGIDLSWAGRPGLKEMYGTHLEMHGKEAPAPESPLEHFQKSYEDLINEAADKTTEERNAGGEKILEEVTHPEENKGMPGEAEVGVASGAVRATFAPITGIIQALIDKAGDSKALQDFATGNKTAGGILDLHEQLEQKLGEAAKQHPEIAKNIGDIANVLGSVLGGETEPGEAAAQMDLKAPEGAAEIPKSPEVTPQPKPTEGVPPVKPAAPAHIGKGMKTNATTALKSAYSQVYGLPPDTINFLLKNPHFATPDALSQASLANLGGEVEGKITADRGDVPTPTHLTDEVKQGIQTKVQALNEHARQYSTLGADAKPGDARKIVEVKPDWLKNKIEDAGLKIGQDGRIEYQSSAEKVHPINVSDSPQGAQIMQNLWDEYGPKFATGRINRDTFLKFRQSLAQIANYRGGVDTAVEKVAHGMRDAFNKEYRPSIPGLDKIDAEHTRLQTDLDSSMKGLAVQDPATGEIKMQDDAAGRIMSATRDTKDEFAKRLEGIAPGITKKVEAAKAFTEKWKSLVDETGSLRENALNNIKNSVNPGRDLRLQKLEELMPGITDRIKLVKAAEDFHGTLGLKPGKYAAGAAISQVLAGNPFMGLAGVAATAPQVGLKILKALGEMSGPAPK